MRASKLPDSFWESTPVNELITAGIRAKSPSWEPPADTPAWMGLRQQIIVTNTYGREIVPPPFIPPYIYLIDQVPFEKDYDVATYLRFRCLLGVAADLLTLFRVNLEGEFGVASWKRASCHFRGNAKKWTLFGFLAQVSATDRRLAVDYLILISKRGLEFNWPGKIRSRFRSNDCGLQALVAISTEMIHFLRANHSDSGKSKTTTDGPPSLKWRAQVGIDTYCTTAGNRVFLKTTGRVPIRLAEKPSELIKTLMREGLLASDETLCKALWPSKTVGTWEAGSRNGLKTLTSSLNKLLTERWGTPPNNERWISRRKDDGYYLNSSVRWAYVTQKDFKRKATRTVDPRILDRESTR